jgi:hypothetical protein
LGNFIGQSGKFLGVKFKAGADTHYGWVQIDVDSEASQATIQAYGYQGVPERARARQPGAAGAGCGGDRGPAAKKGYGVTASPEWIQ